MKQKIERLLAIVRELDEMYLLDEPRVEKHVGYAVNHLREAVDALRSIGKEVA
jgi:hypothetical protein